MTGVEQIAAERRRQVEGEGWTSDHDDSHDNGEMAMAAACYAAAAAVERIYTLDNAGGTLIFSDPWPADWEDKRGRYAQSRRRAIQMLVKAGALIAAEIDRLQRADSAAIGGDQP